MNDLGAIAFIGYGNIARSLLSGLLAAGYRASALRVADTATEKLKEITAQDTALQGFAANAAATDGADWVVLCVKPEVVATVCAEIKDTLAQQSSVLVSVAAGVPTTALQRWTAASQPLIRVMPNTPVAVGCGMTALYATHQVADEHKRLAETMFNTVGATVWLDDEEEMHIVTALSGSGPAYFFRISEAFEKAAAALGCPPPRARQLAVQTLYGAAKLAVERRCDLATLRQQITSKGGTTECGLAALGQAEIDKIALSVLNAAAQRSAEISQQTESQQTESW